MKAKFLGSLAALFGLLALVHAFASSFMRSFNPATRQMFDGYGRELWRAPFPFSIYYSVVDGAWPGFIWMVVDWVAFFGLMGLAYKCATIATTPQTPK